MEKNVLPQDIKVDVSNVFTLVVKFYGKKYNGAAGYGVSNLVATKIFRNEITVYKDKV